MFIPDFVLTEEQIMQMSDAEKVQLLSCKNNTCFYHTAGYCRYGRIDFDFVMGVGAVCTTYEPLEGNKEKINEQENND